MARGKAPSQRQLRVGEEIRHALAEVFERDGLRDPDLQGRSITVTEVRASPDLKNVMVYVMPLGGENVDGVVAALRRASSYLRGDVVRSGLEFRSGESYRQIAARPECVPGHQGRIP